MTPDTWQRRIRRAEQLAAAHPATSEILTFYGGVARLQAELYARHAGTVWPLPGAQPLNFPALRGSFAQFLDGVLKHAPPQIRETVTELKGSGEEKWKELLSSCWQADSGQLSPEVLFVCRAFLQPVAELARQQTPVSLKDYFQPICPYCGRLPGLAILRPEGEGARRSLQCSFCLAEWNFRRILCPSCGEEDHQKLPVYTAQEFDYIRVEACDTCKRYLKSVDLTKNGRAEPVVDEIAAAALDLWACQNAFTKVGPNLMGM